MSKTKAIIEVVIEGGKKVKQLSDRILKNKVKNVQKTPDKKFTYNNPETRKVVSDRPGKKGQVFEVNKSGPVKGSIGKKKYIRDMKRYHHKDVFNSNKIKDIQGAKDGGRMGYKDGSKGCKLATKGKGNAYGMNS